MQNQKGLFITYVCIRLSFSAMTVKVRLRLFVAITPRGRACLYGGQLGLLRRILLCLPRPLSELAHQFHLRLLVRRRLDRRVLQPLEHAPHLLHGELSVAVVEFLKERITAARSAGTGFTQSAWAVRTYAENVQSTQCRCTCSAEGGSVLVASPTHSVHFTACTEPHVQRVELVGGIALSGFARGLLGVCTVHCKRRGG